MNDSSVKVVVALLLSAAILVLIRGLVRFYALRRQLSDARDTFSTTTARLEPRTALEQAVVLRMVEPAPVSLASGPKFVLAQPLRDVLDDYVETNAGHGLSSNWTGIALICTFCLIYFVLQEKVSVAVRDASGGNAGASGVALGEGVSLLGAKFLISAVGVFLAVVHGTLATFMRWSLRRQAAALASALSPHFCTVDAVIMNAQFAQLAELRHTGQQIVVVQERLEALRSIQVSVQDVGSAVTHQLRSMLTNDLGNQIRDMIRDALVNVEQIGTKLLTSNSKAFIDTMQREVGRVAASIEKVQTAVESQARAPVEQLLEKLQGMMSGAFQHEQVRMQASLRQFAEVVPALAEQLKATSEGMSHQFGKQRDDNSRAMESVGAQLSLVLQRMEDQQAAWASSIEHLQRSSAVGADAMLTRLGQGTGDLLTALGTATQEQLSALQQRLGQSADRSEAGLAQMQEHMSQVTRSIIQAQTGLGEAATTLRSLSAEMRGLLDGARASTDGARGAAERLASTAVAIDGSLKQYRDALARAAEQTDAQRVVAGEQQRVVAEMNELWPGLFDRYLKQFDAASGRLQASWEELHKKVAEAANLGGGRLAEAAEELSSSVERLVRHSNGGRST